MIGAAIAGLMSQGPAKAFDWGTIENAAEGSQVFAKRSPAEYSLPRRALAASARVARRLFNYAPASKAPYQLRLSWWVGDTVNLGWLPVTKEVYDRTEAGSYFVEPRRKS